MDDRTAQLLGVLDRVSVSLVVEMLAGPATEADLLEACDDLEQSAGNRRLHALKSAHIVVRETGKERAPGRLWTVVHPVETEAVLAKLFALSEAIDADDRVRRQAARRKLKRARAKRLGIRSVDVGRSSASATDIR